jgi:hypothetical protein
MTIPQMPMQALRQVLATLVGRTVRPVAAEPGRPESAPILGAFGLLASQVDPPRH